MIGRNLLLGALATCALLVANTSAHAAYTYTTFFALGNPGSTAFGSPVIDNQNPITVTYTGVNGTQNAIASIQVGNIGVADSDTTTPRTFSSNYTIDVKITNNAATGDFFIFGTTSGTSVQGPNTGVITNIYNGVNTTNTFSNQGTVTQNIGGSLFSLTEPIGPPPNQNFSAPGVGQGNTSGSFSALVNPTAPNPVPEPASVVMLGLGVGGVGLFYLRNRRVRV